jgi:hypothetical protein
MAPDDDDHETRVKDAVLDAATRAQLEQWFQLPSFTELEEKGVEIADPDWLKARKKRADALAAVDPAILEWHRRRNERDDLIKFQQIIELAVDDTIGAVDFALLDARDAEPRERMLPPQLENDLQDCTPQALLRDLHRPEMFFEKVFEWVDPLTELKVDAKSIVAETMATNWMTASHALLPARENRMMLQHARALVRLPWVALFAEKPLPNRVVTE